MISEESSKGPIVDRSEGVDMGGLLLSRTKTMMYLAESTDANFWHRGYRTLYTSREKYQVLNLCTELSVISAVIRPAVSRGRKKPLPLYGLGNVRHLLPVSSKTMLLSDSMRILPAISSAIVFSSEVRGTLRR